VWGYSVKNYDILTHNALTSFIKGWVLDAGCGSLAFTARTYLRYSERPVVFLDHSIRLLRIAKSRLTRLNGSIPENMVFLHGDALNLPFKPKIFNTIISLNLLHVLSDIKKVLLGLRNVLTENGTMFFTTLIENNRFADKYFNMMGKKGLAVPRKAQQLFEIFNDIYMPVKLDIKGNMAFICYNI